MSETTPGGQSDPVVAVEFRIRDTAYPFVGVSERESCQIELAKMLPRPEGYAEVFNVTGADSARVAALDAEYETLDVSVLAEYDRGGLFEFDVSGNCPAYDLAELGALPQTVRGVDGTGQIVAEIPPQYDSSTVVETFLDSHPSADLATKHERESVTPLFTRSAFRQVLHTCLTDRQREVIETAYEAGYYDWPRECTGTDVAAELDISSATFSEHVHAAERKLLTVLFDGPGSVRSEGRPEDRSEGL